MNFRWKSAVDLFRTLVKLYRLLWNVSPLRMIGIVFCRILLAIFPIIQLYILIVLVNMVTDAIANRIPFVEVLEVVSIQVGLTIITAGVRSVNGMVMNSLKIRTRYHIEELLLIQSSRLPLTYFDRPDFYDSFHRAMASQNSLILLEISFAFIQSLITVVGYLVTIASFHWLLAVVMLVFVVPSLIVNMRLGRNRFDQMVMQTPVARKAQYHFDLLVDRKAAKEIRIFGLAEYLIDRWKIYFWKNAGEQIRLERKGAYLNWGVESFGSIIGGVFIAAVAWLGTQGRLSIGQYVALVEAFKSANDLLILISSNIAFMYQNVLYARELFDFLELKIESEPVSPSSLPDQMNNGIIVENISFQYPGRSEPAIQNISLSIRPGQKVAIVGDNGAGKTTLAKCLLGLYRPSNGIIRLDGINLNEIDRRELGKKITAVFQDYVQFQLTARENIGFGNLNKLNDDNLLEVAAAKSGADEFIENMQERYDAQLGPMFDGGQELSQGQWQKIALSRAYFRDADIVVLDEPTASMDPITEASIFENFLQIAKGKTAVIITHRLGICKAVDWIIVLKNGQVVEQGVHEELLESGGEYQKMYQTQSKWYEN